MPIEKRWLQQCDSITMTLDEKKMFGVKEAVRDLSRGYEESPLKEFILA